MNKWMAQLADLPWPKVLVVGIVVLGLYYVAAYDDGTRLTEQLEQGRMRLAQAEAQFEKTKSAMADANRFEQQVRITAEQFERIGDFMPEKIGSADLTTILSEQASKAGASLSKTEPIPQGEKAGFYETAKMNFVVEGSFSQLLTFLSYVSRVPRLLTFEKVEMTTKDASDPEKPRLAFQGTIIGYKYLKQADNKEGGAGAKK